MSREILVSELRRLATDPDYYPPFASSGICYRFSQLDEQPLLNACKKEWQKWNKFSGDYMYPVRCLNYDPHHAFNMLPLWDPNTEYGRDRRELCGWLADRIEEGLTGFEEYRIASHFGPYIVNADASEISDEDQEAIDKWLADHPGTVIVTDRPHEFAFCDATGLMADCMWVEVYDAQ